MIKVSVFFTEKHLGLKNLILNEDKTFIIGKVQDKNSKLDYISTKWKINKDEKRCVCVLGDTDYDFSIEGIFIPGLFGEQPIKVKKNFYTFSKDAWHCKLYKWIYGKEPHKVHPTMCPYFWIMVFTLMPPIFSIILIIKLFGKTGTKFLEQLSTYKARRRDKRDELEKIKIQNWSKDVKENWEKWDEKKLKEIIDHKYWDCYTYEFSWRTRDKIKEKYYDYQYEKRKLEEQKEEEIYLKKQEKLLLKNLNLPKQEIKQDVIHASKTSKIIGIGFIIIIISLGIWAVFSSISKLSSIINWKFVGEIFVFVLGAIIGLVALYLLIIYVFYPIFNKIIYPLFKFIFNKVFYLGGKYCIILPINYIIVKPISAGCNKLSKANYKWFKIIINKLIKVLSFIYFLISYPFIMVYNGFMYMIEFFRMCKDLIYQMYKKNCPVITWTEENDKYK